MVRVNPDPYLVLGVAPTATQAEITHAYRTHLRAHHPDTRPAQSAHTADDHLRQVLAAYALLRDPARRPPPHPTPPPPRGPNPHPNPPPPPQHRHNPRRTATAAGRPGPPPPLAATS